MTYATSGGVLAILAFSGAFPSGAPTVETPTTTVASTALSPETPVPIATVPIPVATTGPDICHSPCGVDFVVRPGELCREDHRHWYGLTVHGALMRCVYLPGSDEGWRWRAA